MLKLLRHVKDVAQGKTQIGKARSTRWPTVRKHFLETNPTCAVCGSSKNVEAHHITPFHKDPSEELSPGNLIPLCESRSLGDLNCHLIFGHLSNFKSWNVNVKKDAKEWLEKFKNKPFLKR